MGRANRAAGPGITPVSGGNAARAAAIAPGVRWGRGRRDMIATRDWKRLAQIYLDVYAAAGALRERAEKAPKSLRDTVLVQP